MKFLSRRHNRAFIAVVGTFSVFLVLCISCSFFLSSKSIDADSQQVSSQNKMKLTKEEEAYQEKHPTITVAADASWRPLEYMEDGKYTGVIAQVLSKLEEYTGFQIKYEVMDSYTEALKEVQDGKADMISGVADSAKVAEDYNLRLSKTYLTINSAVVSKGQVNNLYDQTKKKKIAVVDGDYANRQIKEEVPNTKLVLCPSNEDCLDLVNSGDVDMAIIASYCAEYYMTVPKYSELKSHTVTDFSWNQAFGICRSADPMMTQILNRGIDQLSQTDVNEAVYNGLVHAAYDNDLVSFVYKHPILVISIVLLIFSLIAILLLIIYFSRKKEQKREIEDGTRLRLALERTHLCIWEMDIATRKITKINNEREKHGFNDLRENIPESVIEAGWVHPDDIMFVRDAIAQVQNGDQNVQGSWRVKEKYSGGKDSIYWWEQVLFHVIYDEKGQPLKVIGVSEDVTKEKNAQRDSLTLVYNRSSFEQMASRVLNERRNAYLQCAYLILDLDGFKGINDTYGHGMGDRVLISVGNTLNKTFRSTDIVGRLGGDEFTVFMTSISKEEDAFQKAQEVIDNINRLQKKESFPFAVSCSLGLVVAAKGQEELATLYKKADTALYEAKRAGKNQYRVYE